MWEFLEVVDTTLDPADNYIVRVLIATDLEEQCIHLKFQSLPDVEQIINTVNTICDGLNNPVDPLAEKY